MASPHLLCVDPDEEALTDTVDTLQAELTDLDIVVKRANTLERAEASLSGATRAVVTEYDLPDGTGFDLIRAAREVCPDAGCVLYTDRDPDTIDTDELMGTITEYVGKGSVFGTERLAELLRTTIESRVQTTYPVPQDESDRLAALKSYNLDDPELVSTLDQITDLAATHFTVDIASINIITEHSQDFLACYGAAEEWESVNREESICTFTILEDNGVMTVEDVTEDPRFESRSDSLVADGIRAYIGANLVTPAGLVIGPLCIYDDEPRSFTSADEDYLQKLASVAMDIIELHARLDAVPSPERWQR